MACQYLLVEDGLLKWAHKKWEKASVRFTELPKADGDALAEQVEACINKMNQKKATVLLSQGAHDRYVKLCVASRRPQLNVGQAAVTKKSAPARGPGLGGLSGVLSWNRTAAPSPAPSNGTAPAANGDKLEARDSYGQTALAKAAAAGSTQVVRELLKQKADPNSEDKWGRTPVQWAVDEGRVDAANALRKAGGKLGKERQALLRNKSLAVERQFLRAAREGDTALIDSMLAKHNKALLLAAVDSCGQSALSKAAAADETGAVQALVKAGADKACTDKWGRTAGDWAQQTGSKATRKALA